MKWPYYFYTHDGIRWHWGHGRKRILWTWRRMLKLIFTGQVSIWHTLKNLGTPAVKRQIRQGPFSSLED